MTREEKVNLLNTPLEIEEKNDIGNLTSTDRREFQQWVEDLEQEPILDKIKEEISQLPITDTAIKLVTAVLDKYKTEVEVKE